MLRGETLERAEKGRDDGIVLCNEMNHRIKNNLQILIGMMSQKKIDIANNDLKVILDECINHLSAISMLHEFMYKHRNDEMNIDFSVYCRELVDHIVTASSGLLSPDNVKLDIVECMLGAKTAMYCGMIINEIIMNRIKHSRPGDTDGVLSISMQPQRHIGNSYKLLVTCDGGIDPEKVKAIGNNSFGIRLINVLVAMINGYLMIRGDNGIEYEILFSEDGNPHD